MKKIFLFLLVAISLIISSGGIAEAHSGRTDSSGGHNCSQKSISKGLCSGYHYHNGGSSSTKSSSNSSKSSSSSSSSKSTSVAKPVLTTVDVYIDNNWKSYDPSAYMKNGTTLVPMRAIFEDLGATLEFNNKTNTITAYKDNKEIVITIGNNNAFIKSNGVTSSIKLTNPAEIYEGSTMVPLRFISETLGANIKWDSENLAVYITTKDWTFLKIEMFFFCQFSVFF